MANYAPIRPAAGAASEIPALPVRTLIQAIGGTMLISSDAVLDPATAIELLDHQTHVVPANQAWRCMAERGTPGVELRRQDYE